MIGQSLPEYVFIHICIFGLRLVAPASILYLLISAYLREFWWSPWLAVVAIPEAAFYLLVFLPRWRRLQKPAKDVPPALGRAEREALFRKCHDCILETESDVTAYPMGWFRSPSNVKREDVREWLLWALFASEPSDALLDEWHDELEGYIKTIETTLGTKFEEGRTGKAESMRLPFDPVQMIHRPLVWYAIVFLVDNFTAMWLMILGFQHFAPTAWFQAFPPRPFSLISKPASTPHFSYWYRPHKSPSKKPIIFIHGIGIGLYPYIPFVRDLITADPDVGLLLIELVPITMHMTPRPIPLRTVMLDAISATLTSLDIPKAILATHSFGTTIAAHVIRSRQAKDIPVASPVALSDEMTTSLLPTSFNDLGEGSSTSPLASKISSILMIDPIPILLHLPDVAFNFLYRSPSSANEWQLWYFASRDADVARVLGRHFFWHDCVLWKEDILPDRNALERDRKWEGRVAVLLSGNDQIVASSKVWTYLTSEALHPSRSVRRGSKEEELVDSWTSPDPEGKLQVLFYHGLDHATVFDTAERRKRMVEVVSGRFNG